MNSTLRAKLMARLMKDAKGFTLIELLVVIVIVGVLSAVAVPTFLNQVRRSRVAEAQASLGVVTTSADIYRFDQGVYPDYVGNLDPATGVLPNGNAAGNRYMDAVWAQSAPNYNAPTTANGAPTAAGVVYTTTAIVGAGNQAYTNNTGAALECDLAAGNLVERAGFEAEEGCNL